MGNIQSPEMNICNFQIQKKKRYDVGQRGLNEGQIKKNNENESIHLLHTEKTNISLNILPRPLSRNPTTERYPHHFMKKHNRN